MKKLGRSGRNTGEGGRRVVGRGEMRVREEMKRGEMWAREGRGRWCGERRRDKGERGMRGEGEMRGRWREKVIRMDGGGMEG